MDQRDDLRLILVLSSPIPDVGNSVEDRYIFTVASQLTQSDDSVLVEWTTCFSMKELYQEEMISKIGNESSGPVVVLFNIQKILADERML